MKLVYRSLSFWACVVLFLLNLPVFYIGLRLNDSNIYTNALITMAILVVGATSHWAGSAFLSKKTKK